MYYIDLSAPAFSWNSCSSCIFEPGYRQTRMTKFDLLIVSTETLKILSVSQ